MEQRRKPSFTTPSEAAVDALDGGERGEEDGEAGHDGEQDEDVRLAVLGSGSGVEDPLQEALRPSIIIGLLLLRLEGESQRAVRGVADVREEVPRVAWVDGAVGELDVPVVAVALLQRRGGVDPDIDAMHLALLE